VHQSKSCTLYQYVGFLPQQGDELPLGLWGLIEEEGIVFTGYCDHLHHWIFYPLLVTLVIAALRGSNAHASHI
jgi:hypothetical protein